MEEGEDLEQQFEKKLLLWVDLLDLSTYSLHFNVFFFFFHPFSAGGLVTAVAPVVAKCEGLWVGWPGIFSEDAEEHIPESEDDMTPTAGLLSSQVNIYLNFINLPEFHQIFNFFADPSRFSDYLKYNFSCWFFLCLDCSSIHGEISIWWILQWML